MFFHIIAAFTKHYGKSIDLAARLVILRFVCPKKDYRNYLIGIAWFLVGLVISVSNDTLMKFLGKEYSAAQIVFLRYTFATLSLLPFLLGKKDFAARLFRVTGLHFIRAILLLLGMWLYCLALPQLPISTVVALNFVIPIFTLILAAVFLREKITRRAAVATIFGFAGILIVCEPTGAKFITFAMALVLLSSALFASLDVINKKFVSDEGVFQMVLYTATITALLSFPFALCQWTCPPVRDVCLFAALGCGANLLLYCILKAFERVDISTVAPLKYFEFALTAAVGMVVFGEIPSKSTMLGALIIITSTLCIIFAEVGSGR
ncbi:MAG: DMT family transporter [Puniceicoccales bacterium]|jgi:drug/metabolite transporter (DMT)-like permease|nr:DMT family transporter [Puniceicoccales bacterium]